MRLVTLHGGTHHGYFLPAEGSSDAAEALFTFPSLAAYEYYRQRFTTDPDFTAADQIRDQSGCVIRYDRTFMRPLLPEPSWDAPNSCHRDGPHRAAATADGRRVEARTRPAAESGGLKSLLDTVWNRLSRC